MENAFGLSTQLVVEVGRFCCVALSIAGVPSVPLCMVDLMHIETAASETTFEHEIIGTGTGDGAGYFVHAIESALVQLFEEPMLGCFAGAQSALSQLELPPAVPVEAVPSADGAAPTLGAASLALSAEVASAAYAIEKSSAKTAMKNIFLIFSPHELPF